MLSVLCSGALSRGSSLHTSCTSVISMLDPHQVPSPSSASGLLFRAGLLLQAGLQAGLHLVGPGPCRRSCCRKASKAAGCISRTLWGSWSRGRRTCLAAGSLSEEGCHMIFWAWRVHGPRVQVDDEVREGPDRPRLQPATVEGHSGASTRIAGPRRRGAGAPGAPCSWSGLLGCHRGRSACVQAKSRHWRNDGPCRLEP